MKPNKKKRKYPKLPRQAAKEVSQFVAEERRAGRPRAQAIAIAFSRERAALKQAKLDKLVAKYL